MLGQCQVFSESGRVYVWGSNSDGQLGIQDAKDNVLIPKLLSFNQKVTHISCGYYHTAFVTAEAELYTCGEGENGKLGLPNSVNNSSTPTLVTLGAPVKAVTCGGNTTFALTEDGKVFAFGSNLNGELGLEEDITRSILPTIVTSLDEHNIVQVICGENHTAFVTDAGKLYICGEGRYGKLCNEDIDSTKQNVPTRVSKFRGYIVDKVACGGCHTMVFARRNPSEDIDDSNALDNVDNLLAFRALPPLQNTSAASLNNNMDQTEDEDKLSTTVEHHSSHSKEVSLGSAESVDMNGNENSDEAMEHEVDDKGDFSDGTEHLDDTDERTHDIQKLEGTIEEDGTDTEDGERDNDDVTVGSKEKKEGRMSRILGAFRRKKSTSAQSTRTTSSKEDDNTVKRQRSARTADIQDDDEIVGEDISPETKSRRRDCGKLKSSEPGNHKKSKACTVL